MDFDLSPKLAQNKLFDGEGGSYYSWSPSQFPLLGEAKVGAGRLVLQPRGFALPHYSDSSKVGYVLQGTEGIVGMVLPNSSEEAVLKLKKGDAIPVPIGLVSWWYNKGDSDFIVVFIGETSKAYVPGEFTYFLLTGGMGIMAGFSPEFIGRAYGFTEKEAKSLANSQSGVLIIKLEEGKAIKIPQPLKNSVDKMVINIDAASPDVSVKRAGLLKTLTAEKFVLLQNVGLTVEHLILNSNAICSPTYTADGTVEVVYVARGSGCVQIVGINGERVLDTKIEAGQMFVVPKFFVAAKIAGDDGIECFSILTSTWPVVEELASKRSVWNILSPEVSQIALNVTSKVEELLRSNIGNTAVLIPPSN